MWLKAVVLLVLLSSEVSLLPYTSDGTESDPKWSPFEKTQARVPGEETLSTKQVGASCSFLKLPESQQILASDVQKVFFKSEAGTRPLPDVLKSILLPPPTKKPVSVQDSQPKTIEILCHLDRIYVRVLKNLLTSLDAWKNLKVGTCVVNQMTSGYYFFLYAINSCGVKRQEDEDRVTFSNTLTYEPVTNGLFTRELLTWNVITPKTWKPLANWQSFVAGQPMYFVAKAPESQEGKRLYLNKCYITTSQDPESTPKYTVLDNYGCMVDGKNTPQSTFFPSNSMTTVRFAVGAILFKDMVRPGTQKSMFFHCEMTLGPESATLSAKSCLYKTNTKQWSELYGKDHACCDASCPSPESLIAVKMISSDAWELEYESEYDTPVPRNFKSEEEDLDKTDFDMFWDY
ncbi:zona pellucida sperm-binding protein 3 [Trichomycterus rosablanca]|uniref:zona pellucida sperm-binding protein 3 n=1 Tax=Trichomycterus rosablanca TaxID=2290929 RepID=UPI002F3536B3